MTGNRESIESTVPLHPGIKHCKGLSRAIICFEFAAGDRIHGLGRDEDTHRECGKRLRELQALWVRCKDRIRRKGISFPYLDFNGRLTTWIGEYMNFIHAEEIRDKLSAEVRQDIPDTVEGVELQLGEEQRRQAIADAKKSAIQKTCQHLLRDAYELDQELGLVEQIDPPTQGPTALARGKKSTVPKWTIIQKRLLRLRSDDNLPKSIRAAAKFLSASYGATRDAIVKSPILARHYRFKPARKGPVDSSSSLVDELTLHANADTRRILEQMTPRKRRETESAMRDLALKNAHEAILGVVGVNPDSGRAGDVPHIEAADRDCRTGDRND